MATIAMGWHGRKEQVPVLGGKSENLLPCNTGMPQNAAKDPLNMGGTRWNILEALQPFTSGSPTLIYTVAPMSLPSQL